MTVCLTCWFISFFGSTEALKQGVFRIRCTRDAHKENIETMIRAPLDGHRLHTWRYFPSYQAASGAYRGSFQPTQPAPKQPLVPMAVMRVRHMRMAVAERLV